MVVPLNYDKMGSVFDENDAIVLDVRDSGAELRGGRKEWLTSTAVVELAEWE